MLGVKFNDTTSCKIDGWLRSKIGEGSEHKEFNAGETEKTKSSGMEGTLEKNLKGRSSENDVRNGSERD